MSQYKLSQKFPNKTAFITGGGSGLGKEMALKLAADGWSVGITDINANALVESKKLIEEKGGKAFTFTFDVSDKVAYEKAFNEFVSTTGSLDVMINNAGVGDGGLFGEYELKNWDWITGINQMAVIYGCHFAVLQMKKQGSGHIINIASAAGYANMPNMAMYNVTKAAVISLSESLYAELVPFGIGISVVMPTFFRSNIMQHNRGPEEATAVGKVLSQKAKITPDVVADKILTQAGAGTFHIFHPFQANAVWYLKRFLPNVFLKVKANMFQKKDWVRKKIMARDK
jgi:short-subunit dehydrogenase